MKVESKLINNILGRKWYYGVQRLCTPPRVRSRSVESHGSRTLIVTLEHAISALGADQTLNMTDKKVSVYIYIECRGRSFPLLFYKITIDR